MARPPASKPQKLRVGNYYLIWSGLHCGSKATSFSGSSTTMTATCCSVANVPSCSVPFANVLSCRPLRTFLSQITLTPIYTGQLLSCNFNLLCNKRCKLSRTFPHANFITRQGSKSSLIFLIRCLYENESTQLGKKGHKFVVGACFGCNRGCLGHARVQTEKKS